MGRPRRGGGGAAGTRPRGAADQAQRRRVREERRSEQLADDPEGVARELCLRLLTARPRSAGELADAMAGRGVPGDVAQRVLQRFGEVGLVDDAAFARSFVEARHASRGLSRRALGVELRRKGVEDQVVDEAVQLVDDDREESAARELARRRLAVTRSLPSEVRVRRAVAALARRGHAPGLAYRVVREELAAAGAPVSDDDEGLVADV